MNLNNKPKAIIWDVDETLIEKTSWIYLIQGLHADPQIHMKYYRNLKDGLISFDEAKPLIIANLKSQITGNITCEMVMEICQRVEIFPEVLSLIPKLQRAGVQMCLISAGINVFVVDIATRLGIKYWYANSSLLFDPWGNLIDFCFNIEMEELKVRQLTSFLDQTNLEFDDCVAIGDGDTDRAIFEKVRGIAFNSDDESLNNLAWKQISQLSELEEIFQDIISPQD